MGIAASTAAPQLVVSKEVINEKVRGSQKAVGKHKVATLERLGDKLGLNSHLHCQLSDLGQDFNRSEPWFPHQRNGDQNFCLRRLP